MPARTQKRRNQQGYVLLMLLLSAALLAIGAAALAPTIAFQLRRDREQELIHRGVQYSRAVGRYYKKFGRYPGRVEDLEKSNNIRFLRKRYKDPITGKDFKLLHVGEVKTNFQAGIAGAAPAGLNQAGGFNQGQPGGSFGGPPGGIGLVGRTGMAGPSNAPPQASPSDNDSDSDNDNGAKSSPGESSDNSQTSQNGVDFSNSGGQNQVFGGGAIVGVVSTSTEKSIREFSDKKRYSEWQFIYDPTMDRGGLLTAPGIPKTFSQGIQGGQTPGTPGGTPGAPSAGPSPPTPPNNGPGNQNDNDNDQD